MNMKKHTGFVFVVVFLLTISMLFQGVAVFGQESSKNSGTSEKQNSARLLSKAEAGTLTQADLKKFGVELNQERISLDHFDFECHDQKHDGKPVDLKPAVKSAGYEEGIPSGTLAQQVPRTFSYNGNEHMYKNAYVGASQVYYAGVLEIGDSSYIYYITDKEKTDRTVYSVLKENQKIKVRYDHSVAYTIDYEFVNEDANGATETAGPDGKTLDEVFGEDRPEEVANDGAYAANVTIPRGYEATISVYNVDENGKRTLVPDKTLSLGKAPEYERSSTNKNKIVRKNGSVDSLKYQGTLSQDQVTQKQVVVLSYKKVQTIQFDASLWTKTANANGRIEVEDTNTLSGPVKFKDHQYTWKFAGITTDRTTWEMDQLELNGESINVPMTTLSNTRPVEETTTLSSGTVVTLTVQSKGGANGNGGQREYTLSISNCYENITISNGNMVGHAHKEIVVNKLHGVSDARYGDGGSDDGSIYQKMLLGRKKFSNNIPTSYFSFTRGTGYRHPDISVTMKDGTMLQKNGTVYKKTDNTTPEYLEYFIKDSNGAYNKVSYDKWAESADGRWYFRGSGALTTFMNQSDPQGVVLLNIDADPVKTAVDYTSGEGRVDAPVAENIVNMPKLDRGGSTGYTCENNSHVIISTTIPSDKTGEYIFDHWEVLKVDTTDDPMGKVTDEVKQVDGETVMFQPGQAVDITATIYKTLRDCYYYSESDAEDGRAVITLRAVWTKADTSEVMHYNVHFMVNDAEVLVRSHTVDKGGQLISDLYQKDGKTLSSSLQSILNGNNTTGTVFRGRYIVDKSRTTMRIDSVMETANNAFIYLVSADTQASVELNWSDNSPKEESAKVQLQRRVKGSSTWENTGSEITLQEENGWKHDFSELQKYKDDDAKTEYEYRVVEVQNQIIAEDGSTISFGENQYKVGYLQKDGNAWVITNTYEKKEEPTQPTEPSKPSDPSQPTQPSQPGTAGSSAASGSGASASGASGQQAQTDGVATGDDFSPILWIAIAAAALAGVGVVFAGTRRRKNSAGR